jgi:TonB family protein
MGGSPSGEAVTFRASGAGCLRWVMDGMDQDLGLVESVVEVQEGPVAVPALLVELPPWHKVFLHNLGDTLWPPQQPPLRLASKPSDFWPDVFVRSRLPWGRFLESALYHTAVILTVWAGSLIWPQRVQTTAEAAFHHDDVIYYQASEYLPPLDTGGAKAPAPQKGQPAYAPQPIISVPPEADNHRQTIVTPPDIKLNHEVPLPNVVAWAKTPQAMPIAATERTMAEAKAPDLSVPVVAPPPDVQMASSTRVMSAPQPAVVEPAPVVNAASTRRLGQLNIGHSEVVAPAPQLPMQEQRTLATGDSALGNSGPAVVPPPPSVQGPGVSSSGGRLIALSIHPVAPAGPVEAPAGNRRGSFAAGPQGKSGAPGTPDVAGGSHASGTGGGKGQGGKGAVSGSRTDMPSGLYVGAGPSPNHSAIGGNGQGKGTGGEGASSKNPIQMASVTPPRVTSTPRRAGHEVSSDRETDEEKKVFGDRKFYAMTLNVPNLNSAGGSWVVHFAELGNDDSKGELTAPVATVEADPAYPLELMKQNVQGTVTLYAVIRSDGSVGDVRVLNGPDDRLGQYAREALERWQFRPATKNGVPVSLEAVVRIPFRPGKARPLF